MAKVVITIEDIEQDGKPAVDLKCDFDVKDDQAESTVAQELGLIALKTARSVAMAAGAREKDLLNPSEPDDDDPFKLEA